MSRDVQTTLKYIDFAQELRKNGTIAGTNLIIDYNVDGEIIHNYDEDWLAAHFDYWAWNPYFDGKWEVDRAKEPILRKTQKNKENKNELYNITQWYCYKSRYG